MDIFPKFLIIYSFAILQVQDNHGFKNTSSPFHEGKALDMEWSGRIGLWCTCGMAEQPVLLCREGEPQSWCVKCVAHAVCLGDQAGNHLRPYSHAS